MLIKLIRTTGFALFFLMPGWACAQINEPADQLERARLLREMVEARPDRQPTADVPNLAGARIDAASLPAADGLRRQQFEDRQWRKLLGDQQTQIHAPATQPIPQTQWRAQTLERERRAEDLSADILRRSRDFLSNSQR